MQFCKLPLFFIISIISIFFGLSILCGGSALIYESTVVSAACTHLKSAIHPHSQSYSASDSKKNINFRNDWYSESLSASHPDYKNATNGIDPIHLEVCKAAGGPLLAAGCLVIITGVAQIGIGIFYIIVFSRLMDTSMTPFIICKILFLVFILIGLSLALAYHVNYFGAAGIFTVTMCAIDLVFCAIGAVMLGIYSDKDLSEMHCGKQNQPADWSRRPSRRYPSRLSLQSRRTNLHKDRSSKGSQGMTNSKKPRVRFQLPPTRDPKKDRQTSGNVAEAPEGKGKILNTTQPQQQQHRPQQQHQQQQAQTHRRGSVIEAGNSEADGKKHGNSNHSPTNISHNTKTLKS